MEHIVKILFVEDVIPDAELIWCELKKRNIAFSKLLVNNRKEYLNALEKFIPDIIISDYSLPEFDGMSALALRNEIAPLTPFIIVTGSISEEVAVECMKAGADDYILKEKLSRLGPSVINAQNKISLLIEKADAEKELRKSELRLLRAQSIAHVGNWELDLSSRNMWVSEEALRIYGYDKHNHEVPLSIVQKSPLPEYRSLLDEAFNNLLKYNEPYEAEFKIIRTNDSAIRSILSKAELLIDPENGKVTIIGVIQDITERKDREDELFRAKEKAEEADRLKTAFLQNISHEIRTPMNAIIGFSTLLGEHNLDAQTRQSYIEIIVQSGNHLLGIITDIIEISNIEANLTKVVKNEINLNSKLKTLCDQLIPKAEAKKLKLIYETALSLNDASILTDSKKLLQVLTILINNAIKFTHSGQIKLAYKVKDTFLEFSVSDTGIGIAKEYHQKIFDRFYQVQNTVSRIYEGTGLGLSISKAYIEQMGGKIWLKSEPGKGTIFYFTVPFEKSGSATSISSDKVPVKNTLISKKKTILIAEDIESNFKLLKYFLSESDIEILRAFNGKEAVEICVANRNIDLVLMDIKMPVMNGYTAIKLIREKIPAIPIIVQTAYADDREKAIECGCSGYISKPFDKQGLLRVINEYI
jgi:PAS domain S-box-containing protein